LTTVVEEVTIFTDSQLALRSLNGQSVGTPRALVLAVRRALNKARNHTRGTEVTLSWCPGHTRSRGNETADEEAKAAARGKHYPLDLIPEHLKKCQPLTHPSRIKETLSAKNQSLARSYWTASRTHDKMSKIYQDSNTPAFLELATGLNRSRATLLFRLITGHVALGDHLAHIHHTDTNTCDSCKSAPETVAHFLLQCPTYAADHHEHLGSRGRDFLSLNFLLTNKMATSPLFKFIKATGRFVDSLR
jgi:hypothetical protein